MMVCIVIFDRFIKRYSELEAKAGGQSDSQLFEAVKESLKAEGIVLKTLDEVEQVRKIMKNIVHDTFGL